MYIIKMMYAGIGISAIRNHGITIKTLTIPCIITTIFISITMILPQYLVLLLQEICSFTVIPIAMQLSNL